MGVEALAQRQGFTLFRDSFHIFLRNPYEHVSMWDIRDFLPGDAAACSVVPPARAAAHHSLRIVSFKNYGYARVAGIYRPEKADRPMTRQTPFPLEHLSLGATNRFVDFFIRSVARDDMLLDAPYQRGDVWTLDQRIGLVRSWLMGLPIPAVIINDRSRWSSASDTLEPSYAVIDGKQRILTAIAWAVGEFAVPASWFPADRIETTEHTDDGPYVRYTGLNRVGQRFSDNRCVLPCAESRLGSVVEEAAVYLLVNGEGTPQTDADMANAARVAAGGTQ